MARILLIEDDPWILNLFSQILEMDGHQLFLAEDGEEGVALYHRHQPDLVVTDMVMPKKDGLQTIMELTREYGDIDIIAISGGGKIEAERYLYMAKAIGAKKTIQKPITRNELLEAVDEVLNPQAAPTAHKSV